ncbi:protein transport protein SEC13 B-like protein [Cinnamomum micranthum f. kanehirae]|uniref:Protein transport protein SEC13 B-like protein n=1 Tax=Cinnamomum micranthum f. kanehirae TaxID=337451 RepID=A0A443NWH0_9MAGN|nr:protein transport protein SEC13 B-like protein [Cinnamomum micranthum f. kanehirae]
MISNRSRRGRRGSSLEAMAILKEEFVCQEEEKKKIRSRSKDAGAEDRDRPSGCNPRRGHGFLRQASRHRLLRHHHQDHRRHHDLANLSGHSGPVWQVPWAHPKYGSILASCSYDGHVIIWNENPAVPNDWSQAHLSTTTAHKSSSYSSVNSISWAPHDLGLILASACSEGSISVFSQRPDGSWDSARINQAHSVGVTSVSWAPSTAPGSLISSSSAADQPVYKLASSGCDNTVKVWKLFNGSWKMDCFPALQIHSDWVRDVAWAPNLGLPKSTIASASQDGTVVIWTVGKEGDQWEGKVLNDFKTPVWSLSWSLTGNILAVSDGNNNCVTLWKEAVDGEWQQVTTVEP